MSQKQKIFNHLKRGWALTAEQAIDKFRCFRLAPRIAELRHEGHDIRTTTIRSGKKSWAKYTLPKP